MGADVYVYVMVALSSNLFLPGEGSNFGLQYHYSVLAHRVSLKDTCKCQAGIVSGVKESRVTVSGPFLSELSEPGFLA